MILTIDVGNTNILGGLFEENDLILHFRKTTPAGASSDEIGTFLKAVIRENGLDPGKVESIGCCSVVPAVNHSLAGACVKYFGIEPFFLRAGVKTGLKIRYNSPKDVGPDRIANAVAGTELYPGRNLVIVDMGTATTFDVVSEDKQYLGGAIVAGIKMSVSALESGTARLPSVEIVRAEKSCGTSTIESIQSGLYFGQIGTIKELVRRISSEEFRGKSPLVLGTGGFSRLFEEVGIFDFILPDLVLLGVKKALEMNAEKGGTHDH
jgi:type III pantothenate kinase